MAKRVKLSEKPSTKSKDKKVEEKSRSEFNSEYVYNLCIQLYKDELDRNNPVGADGSVSHEREIARLSEKKGAEAGLKRFQEYAQIYAPTVRATLRVLARWNQLPDEAQPE